MASINYQTAVSSYAGHYYQVVNTQSAWQVDQLLASSWQESNNLASSLSHRGLQGYLATVTSPQENLVIWNLTQDAKVNLPYVSGGGNYYLGATDRSIEGQFLWETGPESGQSLSQGGFVNWWSEPQPSEQGVEPDSGVSPLGDLEDALVIDAFWQPYPGKWYDVGDGASNSNFFQAHYVKGFVVEYGGLPATYSLVASSNSVNEGGSITFDISTTNVEWGTSLSYSISGVSINDLSSGSLSG